MSAEPEIIVGIDLGTTHAVVAWAPGHGQTPPQIFPLAQLVSSGEVDERPLLPTALYAPLDEESTHDRWHDAPWVIGEYARRRGQEVPGRLVSSAKSWLCHAAVDRTADILPWGCDDDDATPRLSPVAASTRILGHVRAAWNAAHPTQPLEKAQVILTVPASFDQVARLLTLESAAAAGLHVRLLEEPQAAFYAFMGEGGLERLGRLPPGATVLVCDVGGGTTDLTLISLGRDPQDRMEVTRRAVGRHLLLGGDNMDLALAHLCEPKLCAPPDRLDARRFAQLVLACRTAKEHLLGPDAPESAPIAVAGRGASLVGGTLRTELARSEVERVVLDGFLTAAPRQAGAERRRSGLVAFGLPYESDPAITHHLASFFARHCPESAGPDALLLNGGVFRSPQTVERLATVTRAWGGPPMTVLEQPDPDLAVARGAVYFGLAVSGHGLTIGGGSSRGYYLGLDAPGATGSAHAICVLPRGAREAETHTAGARPLALRLGQTVRFDLFSSDNRTHVPGEVVALDEDGFQRLAPVATRFEDQTGSATSEVKVVLEGELSAIGTLDLACVPIEHETLAAERYRLAFELRGEASVSGSAPGGTAQRPPHPRAPEAVDLIERAFGKSRKDARTRDVKDLLRDLERLLGPRPSWTTELSRALADQLLGRSRARRRSADHERLFWLLAGFCLRPGFGHPGDGDRLQILEKLFHESVTFQQEARVWQHFFIAWRRVSAGLSSDLQLQIRERLDPFLAPPDAKLKKHKGFKPLAEDELLELGSWLERVPAEDRGRLGGWVVERTWTNRDPRLWSALGRIGARVPTYASVHHVVSPRTVERWLDHLLREKWEEMPTAAEAGARLARVTNDRGRDVSEAVRREVARRLEAVGARPEWREAVVEYVEVQATDRAGWYGEELPVGLKLLGQEEDG